jgi:predicted ATP-binding protein involved in virulence
MDREDVRTIVKETVKETLTSIGIPDNPQQMQAYMVFLADSYANNQNSKRDFRKIIIQTISPAAMIALWEGAKRFFS